MTTHTLIERLNKSATNHDHTCFGTTLCGEAAVVLASLEAKKEQLFTALDEVADTARRQRQIGMARIADLEAERDAYKGMYVDCADSERALSAENKRLTEELATDKFDREMPPEDRLGGDDSPVVEHKAPDKTGDRL